MGESPNPDWMNQWQAFARQYLSAWQDASRGGVTAPQPSASAPWHEGFEQWSRLFAAGGGQSETIDRVIDSAKSYAAFMQSMIAAFTANAQGDGAPWTDALRQGFAIPAGASLFEHPMARAWQGLAGQGGNGFAQFMSALGALRSPPPADFGELKAWLNLPAFGVMREHQEHYQKMAVTWVDYQEQMRRYNALMLRASQRGFELFEGKLAEREQPGRQIESLRALYDLWVDAAEEGYAEIALSMEFREAYGALVNAQMRVRSQVQQEVERVSVDFGMPTRSELNSIGERLQALRREVRGRGKGSDDALANEVAALREEFAALKAAMKGARPTANEAAETGIDPEPGRSAPPKKRARRARVVAQPAVVPASKKKRKAKATRDAKDDTAAPSKNFASRIAKFANASLGTARAKSHRPEKRADAPRNKKKR
ncbi:class III poly(R)-hydroxyalkanoic acid synthase subunit PhaE [Dokdonella soli]|uniref:Poly(3-hydroxyalkanoate) polymerase subunit PhaE n=1 Tax=Dokdonella soli TaxID=529810 RepID=A0ABP3THK5_9GAMM